jgi:hypothetical protein
LLQEGADACADVAALANFGKWKMKLDGADGGGWVDHLLATATTGRI